ncbi:MAG: hypothetical protein GYA23_00330 [Methanomicrobiales archaeon]|nr:hypothetical protein [Methanomicrobiales archaeon]
MAAVVVTGIIEVMYLLSVSPEWSGILVLVLANALLAAAVAVAILNIRSGGKTGTLPKVIAGIAIALLVIAPCIWAFATIGNGGGQLPVGGPQASRGFNGGPAGNGGPASSESGSGLADYLVSHRGNERWIVAVASSHEAANLILSTGEPVMALGGFSGSDQILDATSLATLINDGEIRYFYGSGGMDNRGGGSNTDVMAWVSSHCSVVEASEYGATGSGNRGDISGAGIPGGLQAGGGTLYDCRNTSA